MKVSGIIFTFFAMLLVLFALIGISEARNDPEGAPPAPGIMMNEPEQPDAPKRMEDVPDQPKFRVRRQMPEVPDMPSPPMPNDMPMPGGK